jgi:endonuclease I
MKKIHFLLLFLPSFLLAQIPAGYYSSVQGLTDQPLMIGLHNIIKNHNVIPYSGLWTAFLQTDKKANGKVWDIYSHNPSGTQPYEYTFGTDQCGSYNSEADCYNREHSWPQSWFNSTPGPDSDLFHIYPTDGHVNGQRGNYPFGKVGTASWTSMNGGKLGNCVSAGYTSTVFEPINEYKGDLARSYFYMTTRYYSEDSGWGSSPATNQSTILSWQLNLLLTWHHQDPVSAKEIARNDSIYKLQNNRNPFIDHPTYADSIWLSPDGIFENGFAAAGYYRVFPNPASSFIYLQSDAPVINEGEACVEDISGKIIFKKTVELSGSTKIDCSSLESGVYFITVKEKNAVSRLKFIKTN